MAEVKKKLQTRKSHRLFVRNTIAKVKELLPESDLGAISPEIKFRLQADLSTLERQQKEIEILLRTVSDAAPLRGHPGLGKRNVFRQDELKREERS